MYNSYMKIIVGLGNPGRTYLKTRHNMGFMVIDLLLNEFNVELNEKKFKADYTIVNRLGKKFILVKPQTFMNNSGEAVNQLMRYYNIDLENLVIIYDDLDLPCGKIRLREKGNDGGHNGLKSLNQHLGTKEYKRIRIGIDNNQMIPRADYVLGKPSSEQQEDLSSALTRAKDAVIEFLDHDFNTAMNKYNKNE